MSVAPHAGIIDFGTFTSPTASQDGIQGEVPAPLTTEIGYALTTEGWAPYIPPGSLGSMAYQNANSVAITGGAIDGTAIGATTASTGKFTSVTTPSVTATTDNLTLSAISTGSVIFSTLNGRQVQIDDAALTNGSFLQLTRGNSANEQRIIANATSGGNNLGLSATGAGAISFYTNNLNSRQFYVSHTASAVNYVQVSGGVTTGYSTISAQGSDTNTGLYIQAKGTGSIRFATNGANSVEQFRISATASAVNYWNVTGSATGFAVQSALSGTDTNISMAFQPKGTGAIDLAAGSSGVNISNGGTVTAITRTAAGSGYTSVPSVAITAPTTAGGVQATATAAIVINGITNIVNGGSGYTLNDVITVSGGTFITSASTLTVTGVSAGVITSVSITGYGTYTVAPTNPASVTGGTGTGATFNLNYAVQANTFTITNAGSGYVEQPTVSFSGGGGSGASAYASVGSDTTIKTIGTNLFLNHPNGAGLQIKDNGQTPAYPLFQSSGTTIQTYASGTSSTIGFQWATKGATNHSFATNASVGNEQFRVSHTASAVNYVQVTGAATGAKASISAQGSDSAIGLLFNTKATAFHEFQVGGKRSFQIGYVTGNDVNYLQIQANATTAAPILSAQGTDTNIDLALTPKGTGRVKFGTYTGTILTPTGYVEIVDSGGTVRRLLVG